jgi:hypothetical protein
MKWQEINYTFDEGVDPTKQLSFVYGFGFTFNQ